MKEKEFNLSEKIIEMNRFTDSDYFYIEDVKEFIRICIALSRKIKGEKGDWINVDILKEKAGDKLK